MGTNMTVKGTPKPTAPGCEAAPRRPGLYVQDVGSSGRVWYGRTFAQVVRQMRAAAWYAPGKRDYMLSVAQRVLMLWPETGHVIWDEGPEAFIASLERVGLVVVERVP